MNGRQRKSPKLGVSATGLRQYGRPRSTTTMTTPADPTNPADPTDPPDPLENAIPSARRTSRPSAGEGLSAGSAQASDFAPSSLFADDDCPRSPFSSVKRGLRQGLALARAVRPVGWAFILWAPFSRRCAFRPGRRARSCRGSTCGSSSLCSPSSRRSCRSGSSSAGGMRRSGSRSRPANGAFPTRRPVGGGGRFWATPCFVL